MVSRTGRTLVTIDGSAVVVEGILDSVVTAYTAVELSLEDCVVVVVVLRLGGPDDCAV